LGKYFIYFNLLISCPPLATATRGCTRVAAAAAAALKALQIRQIEMADKVYVCMYVMAL